MNLDRYRYAVFYQQHGTLPESGGLLDQAATWVDAARLMMGRLAEIDKEDREEADRKRKRQIDRARRRT